MTVLVNPSAGGGRGRRALPAVRATLAGHGLELRVELTESGAHAATLAREAAAGGGELIAFGGDGMVRIAAQAARGTDTVLGLLPGGRGNDFARALSVPLNPVDACRVLLECPPRPIDIGDCNGETFVGIASIGLESEVTRIANSAPRFTGQATYGLSMLAGLARWRPATFRLVLDGGAERQFTGYMAAASNSGRFGGGMRLAPEARLDDGLLDVVVLEDTPRWRFLANSPKVFAGTHVREPGVHVLAAREVHMTADRPFQVYADGDPIAATPAVARCAPGALRMLAP